MGPLTKSHCGQTAGKFGDTQNEILKQSKMHTYRISAQKKHPYYKTHSVQINICNRFDVPLVLIVTRFLLRHDINCVECFK